MRNDWYNYGTQIFCSFLAKSENKSIANCATELLEALEQHEDIMLSAIAESRERNIKNNFS